MVASITPRSGGVGVRDPYRVGRVLISGVFKLLFIVTDFGEKDEAQQALDKLPNNANELVIEISKVTTLYDIGATIFIAAFFFWWGRRSTQKHPL